MPLDLPAPVAAYFAADGQDGLASCFTETAVVHDEGLTYTGPAAIAAWNQQARARYQYTIEPLSSEQRSGRTTVTSRLTGTFPGSPVDLRFVFVLDGEQIQELEIIP